MPKALDFLIEHRRRRDLITVYSPSKYFQLIINMMLAFGIGFEFPMLLVVPADGRRRHARRPWRRSRRYAIVGIAVLVAVITPSGDPISMLALTIPMFVFYEVSIIFGKVCATGGGARRRRRGAAT